MKNTLNPLRRQQTTTQQTSPTHAPQRTQSLNLEEQVKIHQTEPPIENKKPGANGNLASGEMTLTQDKIHRPEDLMDDKKYVNVDLIEWLQNKQIQTGLVVQTRQERAHQIVQMSRLKPGPGHYNITQYSDFKSTEGTNRNLFMPSGTSSKCNMPDYMKT